MSENRFPYRESDYAIRVVQEPTTDGEMVYSAWYAEIPTCESQGDTEQEARENLRDAFELYMTDLQARGLPIPVPASPTAQVREVVAYVVPSTTTQVGSSLMYGEPIGAESTNLPLTAGTR